MLFSASKTVPHSKFLATHLEGGGGTGPEIHFSGTGPVTFLGGTILAWGARLQTASRGAVPAPVLDKWFCRQIIKLHSAGE